MEAGVGGEEEALAVGAADADFGTDLEIAEVVAGDAKEEGVGFVVFVDGALDGGREDLAVAVFALGGAGDGVETDLVDLAAGVDAWGEDAEGLA